MEKVWGEHCHWYLRGLILLIVKPEWTSPLVPGQPLLLKCLSQCHLCPQHLATLQLPWKRGNAGVGPLNRAAGMASLVLFSFNRLNACLLQKSSRAPPWWSWWRRRAPRSGWRYQEESTRMAGQECPTCGREELLPGNCLTASRGKK